MVIVHITVIVTTPPSVHYIGGPGVIPVHTAGGGGSVPIIPRVRSGTRVVPLIIRRLVGSGRKWLNCKENKTILRTEEFHSTKASEEFEVLSVSMISSDSKVEAM